MKTRARDPIRPAKVEAFESTTNQVPSNQLDILDCRRVFDDGKVVVRLEVVLWKERKRPARGRHGAYIYVNSHQEDIICVFKRAQRLFHILK